MLLLFALFQIKSWESVGPTAAAPFLLYFYFRLLVVLLLHSQSSGWRDKAVLCLSVCVCVVWRRCENWSVKKSGHVWIRFHLTRTLLLLLKRSGWTALYGQLIFLSGFSLFMTCWWWLPLLLTCYCGCKGKCLVVVALCQWGFRYKWFTVAYLYSHRHFVLLNLVNSDEEYVEDKQRAKETL